MATDETSLLVIEPSHINWKACVPTMVKAFLWLPMHGKLNAYDMLQKRRFTCWSPSWFTM